jgi:spore coat polysaccharide biosynthesis predicted glycosyltransferase SpsG
MTVEATRQSDFSSDGISAWMPSQAAVICLCDAGGDIGFGHASRCLALAEAFEEKGWKPLFAGCYVDGAEELVSRAGFAVTLRTLPTGAEDPSETVAMCKDFGASAVVLDSYALQPGYLNVISAALPVLLIDDYGALEAAEYARAIVLRPAITLGAVTYPFARLVLSGPTFTPFRRAFRQSRPAQIPTARGVCNIVVTLGGGDPRNVTQRVVEALAKVVPEAAVLAVVGRSYPWCERLAEILGQCGAGSKVLIQVPRIADLLTTADLCICGGGMTKYEAAYLGVPALVISLNESQVEESRLFDKHGLVLDLGLEMRLADSDLQQAIEKVIQDVGLRSELARRGWLAFPADPTRSIVEAFTAELSVAGGLK